MPIALYTPAGSPDPSAPWGGSRLMNLMARALDAAGHRAIAPTDLRSDGIVGDSRRQTALERKAAARARRLVTVYRDLPAVARPEAWLTCDLRHTAPDLIGPAVAEVLGIPYLLAGASCARAEAGGVHASWLSYTARAIARARAVLSFTAEEEESIRPLVPNTARLYRLAPFLDLAPFRAIDRGAARLALANELPLEPTRPWLLAVAPMQTGAALASWRLLGRSLNLIADPPWQLVVVGEGEARWLVEEALAPLGAGVAIFAGARAEDALPAAYAACDLFVWPAYQEPLGMAMLEAQAAGLAVVAQDWPGAAAVVAGGETGLLTPRHDDVAFAGAVVELSTDAERRRAMGAAAAARVQEQHGIESAAATLQGALDAALTDD
ncbi:MAG: glycosyltransferase family 4 protein [Rhodospirillaceae bacterium]|nr:glycosyltransferase family 4 protein [Rhodospirillaceae bacterium]